MEAVEAVAWGGRCGGPPRAAMQIDFPRRVPGPVPGPAGGPSHPAGTAGQHCCLHVLVSIRSPRESCGL